VRHRLQPHRLVIRLPAVQLLGLSADSLGDPRKVLLDIARIDKVTPLDVTFMPRPLDSDLTSDA
jgi:hypothetical protein